MRFTPITDIRSSCVPTDACLNGSFGSFERLNRRLGGNGSICFVNQICCEHWSDLHKVTAASIFTRSKRVILDSAGSFHCPFPALPKIIAKHPPAPTPGQESQQQLYGTCTCQYVFYVVVQSSGRGVLSPVLCLQHRHVVLGSTVVKT